MYKDFFKLSYIEQLKKAVYMSEYDKWELYQDKNSVFYNNINCSSKEQLDAFEKDIITLKYANINISDFSKDGIKQIHYDIFKDIYPWAGQFRLVDISKPEPSLDYRSIEYSKYYEINFALQEKIEKMVQKDWDNMNDFDKINELSDSLSEIWRVHPFVEGNTRTCSKFCFEFAKSVGINIDEALIAKHAHEFRDALAKANDFGENNNRIYELYNLNPLKNLIGQAAGFSQQELDALLGYSKNDIFNDMYYDNYKWNDDELY